MTDERTVKVEFTEAEAMIVASAVGWGRYTAIPAGDAAHRKIRQALYWLNNSDPAAPVPNPLTEEKSVPEKPKRGRPRKASVTNGAM